MPDGNALDSQQLDQLLAQVVQDNGDKVLAWVQGEPGAWGFLAGQGVTAVRLHVDRKLADGERRAVWHRLWWWLEQVKAQVLDSP